MTSINHTDSAVTPTNAITVTTLSGRSNAIRKLTKNIPLNDYGLPEFIYRPDLIPPTIDDLDYHTAIERREIIELATLSLDYTHGFPAVDGKPIWEKLFFETDLAFQAFLMYLNMPRPQTENALSSPIRQLHTLAPTMGLPIETILEYACQNYWNVRSAAYDLYLIAAHNKNKELRLMKAENDHYALAARYIEFADAKLKAIFADPEAELSPKEIMDLLVKMMQMQRLSLGANPNGQHMRKDDERLPQNASVEVILKTIAQQGGFTAGKVVEDSSMQQLMNDPEALAQAQELIIKLNTVRAPRGAKNSQFLDNEGNPDDE